MEKENFRACDDMCVYSFTHAHTQTYVTHHTHIYHTQ